MTLRPPIPGGVLEGLSKCVAEQISNREIDKFLPEAGLDNVAPLAAKWIRVYNAFVDYQNKYNRSNGILIFIQKIVSPVRYINDESLFHDRRIALNKCLIFVGLEIRPNGKFALIEKVETIKEAHSRADKMSMRLQERGVHPDVLKFCRAELVQENYFHAVFESTKSVAEKIRNLSGLQKDGGELVDQAFGLGKDSNPIISINSLKSESELSEHKGFANLLKGMFGMFRNTTGHAPKITWNLDEEDALDCFTLTSLAHRKLQTCIVNKREA